MRDLEAVDPELRLLLAFRKMAREAKGGTANAAHINALLDVRSLARIDALLDELGPCRPNGVQ
jgi:hypothetical protein